MPRLLYFIMLTVILVSLASCGGPKEMTNFRETEFEDVGISISVNEDWLMTVWNADYRAFTHRLRHQPEYIFPPITAVKDDPDPDEETYTHKPNWHFVGVKGEFDPTMNPLSGDYPKPDGLYFVGAMKGELITDRTMTLDIQGTDGIEAVVRFYEETHGTGAYTDLWHAYTITFNHRGNALEFSMRIPSDVDKSDWMDLLDDAISGLTLTE